MSLRSDIIAFLSADSGISALVGTRVYGVVVDFTATNPDSIVVRMVGSMDGHDLSRGTAGYDMRAVEVTCRSKTLATAESIADAVRKKMKGYYGSVGSGTTAYAITLTDEEDTYVQSADGSPHGIYELVQTYRLLRSESLS